MAEKLAARGLLDVQDLWLLLPRQYEDRTRLTPIRALQPGNAAQVEGTVAAVERGFRYRPSLRVGRPFGSTTATRSPIPTSGCGTRSPRRCWSTSW